MKFIQKSAFGAVVILCASLNNVLAVPYGGSSCSNGATNFPTCNTCVDGDELVNNICQRKGGFAFTGGGNSGAGGPTFFNWNNFIAPIVNIFNRPNASGTIQTVASTTVVSTPSNIPTIFQVNSHNYLTNLTFRSFGPEVSYLEAYLFYTNFLSSLEVNNNFDADTRAALVRFQRAHGIPATGFFGPITRRFMTNNDIVVTQ